MTRQNDLFQTINPAVLRKRILIGAGIAEIVIAYFLLGVRHPNAAWGTFWMIKPLLMVPLAGAAGGAMYYFINYRYKIGWSKTFAILAGVVIYIIAVWLGIVLGLNGTLWN